MGRPRRAGRRISILFVAALVGLGAVAGGVALADTIPRDQTGGGRVTEPGDTNPGGVPVEAAPVIPPGGGGLPGGGELPGAGGGSPVTPPVTPPVVTVPPGGGGGIGGGGIGGGGGGAAPAADLSVTKTDSPDPVQPGSNLTYAITVTNNGPDDAQSVQLTDSLPMSSTTFVSLTQNTGPAFTCATPGPGFGGAVTCTLPSLTNGGSANFTLVVLVDTGTVVPGSIITNTAVVSTSTADANSSNNSATATTGVGSADVSITKSGTPDPVAPGANLSYAIQVSNGGPSPASNVSMTDAVPANTTFVSFTQNSGPSATLATPPVGGTGNVTATGVGTTLAVGASANFTLVVNVNANAASTVITNAATASSPVPDPNTSNNTASATTTVTESADLSVTKTDSPDPVTAGTNLTYTIAATNNGPSTAQNVSVGDNLPPGTTFVSFTAPAGWTSTTPAVGGSGSVTATNPSLANGASASFTLVVKVDSGVTDGAVMNNTVTGSTVTSDPIAGNNAATATTTVTTAADVGVSKMAPATATDGTNITYAISVTNNGPSNAPDVSVMDVVPANTTFVSATPAASCSGTTTVTCNVGTVAPGATVNISLVVKLGATTPGGTVITNTASATSPPTDPNGANNSATANTTAVAALQSITVTPANKTLAPGMNQQYTATGDYSDGSTQNLTASAAWSSSSAGVASASPSGLVTATAPGTTNVSASVGGKTGAAGLHVSPLRLITVRPLLSIVRSGETRVLIATGRFANGVTATINDQVTWSSTNSGVAGVSPQGVVTASSPGGVAIVARFGTTFTIPALLLVR